MKQHKALTPHAKDNQHTETRPGGLPSAVRNKCAAQTTRTVDQQYTDKQQQVRVCESNQASRQLVAQSLKDNICKYTTSRMWVSGAADEAHFSRFLCRT